MTAREFYEWHQFSLVHPFPADLMDMHGAMIMALLANVHRDPKGAAHEVSDYLILSRSQEAADQRPKMTEAERMRAIVGG